LAAFLLSLFLIPLKNTAQINKSSHIEWEMGFDYSASPQNKSSDWPLENIQCSDGGYMVCGWGDRIDNISTVTTSRTAQLVKFSNTGVKQWEYQIPFGSRGAFRSVVETDNHFIACGNIVFNNANNGIVLKIDKSGDPSSAKVLTFSVNSTSPAGIRFNLQKVKKSLNTNEVIIAGYINQGGFGKVTNNYIEGLIFAVEISGINDNATATAPISYKFDNLLQQNATTPNFLKWFTRVGNTQTSSITGLFSTTNEITIQRDNASTNSTKPYCKSEPTLTNGLANNSDYNKGYSINDFEVLPSSNGGIYDVYFTGSACWNEFASSQYLGGGSNLSPLTFRSKDVMVGKLVISSNVSNTSILPLNISPNQIKAYPKSAIAVDGTSASMSAYQYAYASRSTRNPNLLTSLVNVSPPYNTNIKNRMEFFYNTQANDGVFISEGINANSLVVGGTYNEVFKGIAWDNFNNSNTAPCTTCTGTYNGLDEAFGDDYKDADFGMFAIDKTTLDPIQGYNANYVTLLGHCSGDDYEQKFKTIDKTNFYYSTTTADMVPVRDWPNTGEDFLVGKCKLETNNSFTKLWQRDIFVPGDPNSPTPAMGICGFGLDITKGKNNEDLGLIICGNNNLNDDDYVVVKLGPDYQSQSTIYSTSPANFNPYNGPVIISANTTYSNITITSGVPIIVNPGVKLILDNCTIKFADSKWLYDQNTLLANNVNSNANSGGFVGIIIQSGGQLEIKNNTLLTGFDVNTIWDGIIVKGVNSVQKPNCLNPAFAGSNSTIERARNAITADNRLFTKVTKSDAKPYYNLSGSYLGKWWHIDANSERSGTEGGAYTYGNNITFLNNDNALDIGKYSMFRNWSQYYDCKFTANAALPKLTYIDEDGEHLGSKQHVQITNNSGYRFYSCHFAGFTPINYLLQTPGTNLHKNANGILALNSDLTVDKTYRVGPTPPSFNNLNKAIQIMHGGIGNLLPSYVLNSRFGRNATNTAIDQPNIENIFINGKNPYGTNLHFNDITVLDKANSGTNNTIDLYPFGIHFQGEKNITCENNVITGDGAKTAENFGIVVADAGASPNMVRLNTLDNLQHSTVSLWQNSNYPYPNGNSALSQGLVWQCNTFNNNTDKAIEVMSSANINGATATVANSSQNYNQGNCVINDVAAAANNRFNYTASNGNLKLDIDGFSQPYEYRFYNVGSVYDPNPDVNGAINTFPCGNTINTFSDVCKSKVIPSPYVNNSTYDVACDGSGGGVVVVGNGNDFPLKNAKNVITQTMSDLAGEAATLQTILDLGDAASLELIIEDPNISNALLRQYLIAAGPYLSDRILDLAIQRDYNPLTNAQIAEIVLQNSPLDESVYERLNIERPTVAGNYAIIQAQYPEYSPRQIIELQIAHIQSRIKYESNYLRWAHLEDDGAGSDKEYLALGNKLLIQNYKPDAAAFYLAANNSSLASTVINNWSPNTIEEQDDKTIALFGINRFVNNTFNQTITPENAQPLLALSTHHSPAAYNATSILASAGLQAIPTAFKPLRVQAQNKNTPVNWKTQLKITNYDVLKDKNMFNYYPIPANNTITVSFDIENKNTLVEFQVFDIYGKLVYTTNITSSKYSTIIPTYNLASGIYFIKAQADNIILNTQKITVAH
jgi:hypothetical protein